MFFPESEYQARVERALELMKEQGLDALMVTGDYLSSHNYQYFTGHVPRDYQANTARTHVFVLTKEGATASCVQVFSELTARACWVEDISVYTQPFSWTDAKALFDRLGVTKGRVGAELGLDQRLMMPVADYEALKESLSGVTFVDAAPLLWDLRMIKSPSEVDAIRESDRINAAALEKTWERATIGMTEVQLIELCGMALIEEGSNRPPYGQMVISSSLRHRKKSTMGPFSGPTDEALQEGDVIFIDSGAIHKGYWGEFNRMAVMGSPSPEQDKWHKLIRDIVAGLTNEVMRPGISCKQAAEEGLALYDKFGVDPAQYIKYTQFPYSHLCHGLGLHSSEIPLVRLTDETILRPGMVFSVEAYVQGHDMRYGSEEDIVLTDDGAEILSDVDPGLYTIN